MMFAVRHRCAEPFYRTRGKKYDELPVPRSYLFDIDSRFMATVQGIKEFDEEGLCVIGDNLPAPPGAALPIVDGVEAEEDVRNLKST